LQKTALSANYYFYYFEAAALEATAASFPSCLGAINLDLEMRKEKTLVIFEKKGETPRI